MKPRVLFLALILASGFFFSSFSVRQTQAAVFSNAIKEVNDLVAGITREKQNQKDLNKMSFDNSSVGNVAAATLMQLVGNIDLGFTGAIPSVGKAIAGIYESPPASGETYVADLMHNMKIGPAQPAYAQVGGLGFAALEPILEAWKQFRNIAYMFFIIVTLVIGFMIMMRQKIGGQAAVTAQQAIPNIVIALITVTFSYAIAGLMIDLMYVVMFLIVGLFPRLSETNVISKDIFQLAQELFKGGFDSTKDAVSGLVKDVLVDVGPIDNAIAWVSGLTFALIIAFAYLFAVVQLFFELLKTYMSIIISILLSPLLLMMGALPGRSDVFQDWIKSLLSNLIAFPVVLLLIVISNLLTKNSTGAEGGFRPPFLIGGGQVEAIQTLVGLAIMLIAKDLVVQAKKSINPKGSGIFEQFGSALSSAVSKGWKGGELIPGVGFTDTNKIPGIGKYVGSGKALTQLGATGIAGLGGAAVGGTWDALTRRGKYGAGSPETGTTGRSQNVYLNRFVRSARGAANFLGYEPLKGGKTDEKGKK